MTAAMIRPCLLCTVHSAVEDLTWSRAKCGFAASADSSSLTLVTPYRGYSEQKRKGFAVVTWSYAVLLIVTLLLHGEYIPTETRWGYWLSALCIVASVSFFVSASLSALKPAVFTKAKRRGAEATHSDSLNRLEDQRRAGTLPPSPGVPVTELSNLGKRTAEIMEPRSVAEGDHEEIG